MLLYILRHGDPTRPDGLTPLGVRQAEALARRLSVHGLDRIFTSPLIRARETARPACEMLRLEAEVEEWTSEDLAFRRFSVPTERGRNWIFRERREAMYLPENCAQTRENWYEAPVFADLPDLRPGYEALVRDSDDFLARLGFERVGGLYRQIGPDPGRVAVFCHQGFGLSWMSHLLYLPPQVFWRGFDVNHSGLSLFHFEPGKEGLCAPYCLTVSDSGHLYGERLPLRNKNQLDI